MVGFIRPRLSGLYIQEVASEMLLRQLYIYSWGTMG